MTNDHLLHSSLFDVSWDLFDGIGLELWAVALIWSALEKMSSLLVAEIVMAAGKVVQIELLLVIDEDKEPGILLVEIGLVKK